MKYRPAAVILFFFLSAGSASMKAQGKWEFSPFGGYETSGSFPVTNSLTVSRLRADHSASFGVFLDRSFTENAQLEFMWNRNMTSYSQQSRSTGLYTKAFNSDIDQFHFGLLYLLRNSEKKLRPFVDFGLGFTHDANTGATPNKTAFSYGLGGGVKYYVGRHFALRNDVRFVPTYANKSPGTYCDPFGFCYIANVAHYLNRVTFTGGLVFRF